MAGTCDAEQLHVSITGESSIAISWASPKGDVADLLIQRSNSAGPALAVKPNSTAYHILCGVEHSWRCRLTTRYASPLLLHAEVDVEPASEYLYRINCGNVSNGLWQRFRTPPALGSRELRMAVVGDLGQTDFSAQTCADLARSHANHSLDLAVLLGDLSYADTDARRWDSFGRVFQNSGCSQLPWLVIPGNHEIEVDDLTHESFIPYRFRWRTPTVGVEQIDQKSRVIDWHQYKFNIKYDYGGSFYSVRIGNAHIIALNPYTAADEASAQVQWLRTELKRIRRSITPYAIVLTHAPFHHSSVKHQAENEFATRRLKESTEQLLINASIDMVFSGHVHAYERSEPIHGIRHFVVGHGGNYEKLYNEWLSDASCSAFRTGDHYGWGILSLLENVSTWSAHRSDTGSVIDAFEVAAGPTGLLDRAASTPECRQAQSNGKVDVQHSVLSEHFDIIVAMSVLAAILLSAMILRFCWKRYHRGVIPIAVQQQAKEERTNLKADVVGAAGMTAGI